MKQEVIPCIFYLYFCSKVRELNRENKIDIKELGCYMHEWRIPKNIRPLIIKEMELIGLIKKDKRFIILNNIDFDLENLGKYYELLKLF